MSVVFEHITAARHDVSKPDFARQEQTDRLFIRGIQDRSRRSPRRRNVKAELESRKPIDVRWLQGEVPWLLAIEIGAGTG